MVVGVKVRDGFGVFVGRVVAEGCGVKVMIGLGSVLNAVGVSGTSSIPLHEARRKIRKTTWSGMDSIGLIKFGLGAEIQIL